MPRKKALPRPLPTIEAYARLTSGIEWVCPDCGKINGYKPVKYRRPRVVCKNEYCEHVFMIGLVVGDIVDVGVPPGNTRVMPRHQQNGITLNRKRTPTEGTQGWARPRGGIFWLCDRCHAWAYDHPDWDTGIVTCEWCKLQRGTGILLWRSQGGLASPSPWDWVPPRGVYEFDKRVARQSRPATGAAVTGWNKHKSGETGAVEGTGVAVAGGVA